MTLILNTLTGDIRFVIPTDGHRPRRGDHYRDRLTGLYVWLVVRTEMREDWV